MTWHAMLHDAAEALHRLRSALLALRAEAPDSEVLEALLLNTAVVADALRQLWIELAERGQSHEHAGAACDR